VFSKKHIVNRGDFLTVEKLKNCRLINLKQVDEEDGSLVFMEGKSEIPFEIKRVFYIFHAPEGVTRADHANKNTDFVLISVHGSSKILVDDGEGKKKFVLSSPNEGLYIPKMIWMEIYDFSSDSVLLVLASRKYEKNQYYEEYGEYCKAVFQK
jgi:dTDP-4-dehydrorhamnose 3,5-epimerase-like enzyme